MPSDQKLSVYLLVLVLFAVTVGLFGLMQWMIERRRDRELRLKQQERQDELEKKRFELEERKLEAEENASYRASQLESERQSADHSGAGSGGYIVIENTAQALCPRREA